MYLCPIEVAYQLSSCPFYYNKYDMKYIFVSFAKEKMLFEDISVSLASVAFIIS